MEVIDLSTRVPQLLFKTSMVSTFNCDLPLEILEIVDPKELLLFVLLAVIEDLAE